MKQLLLAVWFACAASYGYRHLPSSGLSAPDSPIVAPSLDMQRHVGPLRSLLSNYNRAKAMTLAGAYRDFATVAPNGLKTTGQFKAAIQAFDDNAFERIGLAGSLPGYGAKLDEVFIDAFGTEDIELDSAKAKDFINALAWAAGG